MFLLVPFLPFYRPIAAPFPVENDWVVRRRRKKPFLSLVRFFAESISSHNGFSIERDDDDDIPSCHYASFRFFAHSYKLSMKRPLQKGRKYLMNDPLIP